jgi:hypothetical protein
MRADGERRREIASDDQPLRLQVNFWRLDIGLHG